MHSLLLIFCALHFRFTAAIVLTKCCPLNQQLDENGACIPKQHISSEENLSWFPQEAIVSYNTLKVLPENELNDTMAEIRRNAQVRFNIFPSCATPLNLVGNNDDFHLVINRKNIMSAIVKIFEEELEMVYIPIYKVNMSQTAQESSSSGNVSSNLTAQSLPRKRREVLVKQARPPRQLLLPMAQICMDSVNDWYAPHGLMYCPSTPYIPKCCPLQRMYNSTSGYCERTTVDDWIPEADKEEQRFPVLAGKAPYCRDIYFSETDEFCDNLILSYPRYQFHQNGSAVALQRLLESSEYCGEKIYYSEYGTIHHNINFCLKSNGEHQAYPAVGEFAVVANKVTMIFSSIILVISIIIFLLLPILRTKLHEKVTLVHLITFTVGDIMWTISLNVDFESRTTVFAMTIVMQFFYVASFTWLNVMCYDMSSKIGSSIPPSKQTRCEAWRSFCKMSLYAWALPSILLLYAVGMSFVDYPNFQYLRPWSPCGSITQRENAQSYFYIYPIVITLIANMVMYAYSIRKILIITRETAMLRTGESVTTGTTSLQSDKQRLIVFSKLLLLMGLSFFLEMVAWKYEWKSTTASILSNAIHLFRAVSVFIMYSCKKTVWQGLLELFKPIRKHRQPSKTNGKFNCSITERYTEKRSESTTLT